MRNGHYPLPPLRPELQAAYDEMNAKEDYFAYAVCRTYDGQAWEVNTRQGGMCFALDGRHIDHDEAMAAGAAWLLEQLNREPTAAEAAYRALWENMPVPVSRHRRPSRNENDVLHAPYTGRMNHMMPPDAIPCPLSAVTLPYLEGKIPAGFPSPADDFQVERLELLELLTPHPLTTFFWRVGGTSMAEAGISDGDILVVDRALQASHGDVVVAQVDNDFTVKYLHQKAGKVKLVPANPTFPEIVPKDGQTWFVVGVVTSVVKQFRKLA